MLNDTAGNLGMITPWNGNWNGLLILNGKTRVSSPSGQPDSVQFGLDELIF